VVRASRVLLDGRFEEAERLAQQVLAIGQRPRAQNENAVQLFGVQIYTLRREQGRLQEMEAGIRGFVERYPAIPAWRCGVAWVHSELGREAEARSGFEHLAADGFAGVPRDVFWLISVATLCEVCAFLGDAVGAKNLIRSYASQAATHSYS
jgi:hypothetical protein